MSTFGANVREVMGARGVSLAALAEALGVSVQQAAKYSDRAYNNPRLETVFRLAKYLQVSVESLCRGIDPDYDAMRSGVRTPAQFEELWTSIADPRDRESLWYFLMRLAGARTTSDDGPAATASDP